MDEDNLKSNERSKPEQQVHKKSRSSSSRPSVAHGKLKRRTNTSNIFTASFTRNVKSNNASLAKQVAVLKQQLHEMAEDKKQLSYSNMEDRMRHNNELILYAEHSNRIKEYVQQSINELDAHIKTLSKVQREIMLFNNLTASKDTGSTARYYKDDHNRAYGGSKTTQTVNPMVSGLTITQPTISLSRVDNLNLVAAAAARRAAFNTSPSMPPIVETDTQAAGQDSDSDGVDVSLLSRSNRALAQARPANSSTYAELQAAFYRRVHSENGLEGTSGLARRHRKMPQRLKPRPAAATTTSSDDDDAPNRTSLVPIDMDETDVLNLSPIVRKPCGERAGEGSGGGDVPLVPCSVNMSADNALETATGASAVYATARDGVHVSSVASEPDRGPRVSVVPCSVNMSAGNALETATGASTVYATARDGVHVSSVASEPDRGPRVSVVPCSVNMAAGNALDPAKVSVASATAVKNSSSAASKFAHIPSANFYTCTVNMSAGNELDALKASAVVATSAVKTGPMPNHTPSATLPPCTGNLSAGNKLDPAKKPAVKSASGVATKSDRNVKTTPKLNHAPSATLPSCTVNMSAGNALDLAKKSAVKSASRVATKSDRIAAPPPASSSVNLAAGNAPVAIASSAATSSSGAQPKLDHTTNAPVAQCTVNMSAGNALEPVKPTSPSKFPSAALDRLRACVAKDANVASATASADPSKASARATGTAEAESASRRTDEPTGSPGGTAAGCRSTGKSASRARAKSKVSKSAAGTRSKAVLPPESSRSEPLKRPAPSRAKQAAGGSVENGSGGVLYEETPTRGAKMSAAGSAVNLLKVETKEDNKETIQRRALRNIDPTNYKEPSLNKKMRRGENFS